MKKHEDIYIIRRFRISKAQHEYLISQYEGVSESMVVRNLIDDDHIRKRKRKKLKKNLDIPIL